MNKLITFLEKLKMQINPQEFHKSINSEFEIIQNRVRNLIGSAHWGEDGRYKEAVLRSIIRRFLPNNLSIGTGFVLKKSNHGIEISSQIDIIIYDNTYPVLFAEGDILITTPENIKGIIEVKTKLKSSKVIEEFSKATENGKLIGREIFNGIFVYDESLESTNNHVNNHLQTALENSKGIVNHISIGKNIFIKYWPGVTNNNLSNTYSFYRIDNLSFSYFISNLVENTSTNKLEERWWFLYPIEEGKERYKFKDISVGQNQHETS